MRRSTPYHEKDILQRLADGDEVAFSLLYDHYSDLLYKEVYRYLRSSELSRDVVQEIFTTVWSKRETFVSVTHFQAYLVTMGKNLAYQSLLKFSKEQIARREFSLSLENEDSELSRESYLTDLQTLVDSTVEQLPQQQKHVFRLAKLSGMSYAAIAKTMNISPNTVKNHIIAANNFIKKRLQHASTWGCFILAFLS